MKKSKKSLDSENESSSSDLQDFSDPEYDYKLQPKDTSSFQLPLNKYQGKINLDHLRVPHSVQNSLKESQNREDSNKIRIKDKEDRATVEQVLDPRTRIILVKLLNKKILKEINGCLSTGKEANVYHAYSFDGSKEFAIKIYKTSILIFKDRDRYVNGEFRFRNGHCKSNPRKMIKLWAEKELRNLKRIHQSSIPCPEPIFVKSNVLMMEFIGENNNPAPRLKDVENLDQDTYSLLYLELLKIIRVLYQDCRLIHADLSEYNLLFWKEKLYMIDVSQSIEHDHPHALDFLKRDCLNVNTYFKRKGVLTFGIKQIFDFVTDIKINNEDLNEEINKLINDKHVDTIEDEKIFLGMYIPRTLQEVSMKRAEEDMKNNNQEELLYQKLTGLQIKEKPEEILNKNEIKDKKSKEEKDSEGKDSKKGDDEDSEEEDSEGGESEGADSKEDSEETKKDKKGGKQKYDGFEKKERKQKIKEENREKRKNKMPKKTKKLLIKKKKTDHKK